MLSVAFPLYISWTRRRWRWQRGYICTLSFFVPISCCFWNVLCMVAASPLRTEPATKCTDSRAASWYDNYCLFFSIHSPAYSIRFHPCLSCGQLAISINLPLKIILHVVLHGLTFASVRDVMYANILFFSCDFFSFIFYFVQSNWVFFLLLLQFRIDFMHHSSWGVWCKMYVCFCCLIVVVRACNRIGENKCNGTVDVVDIARLSQSFLLFVRQALVVHLQRFRWTIRVRARVTKHDRF